MVVDDVTRFAADIGLICLTLALAVQSNRVSEWIRIPTPAFFLVGAALASDVVPRLGSMSITSIQRLVTVALVVILFDGGMGIGARQFRTHAGGIVWLGVAGTAVTAAALAAACHFLLGFDWRTSMLLGTALAPTDPAVVFSVLGRREISGPSGVLLKGESGANDPVGIALMAGLITAGGLSGTSAVWHATLEFVLQMGVGAAVGIFGGAIVRWNMRNVALPAEGLYPLRVLAGAGAIYAAATLAHGSGFLAVFVAGILLGDVRAPYKAEIERFHTALASLGEIVAFILLGLTVNLEGLAGSPALWAGLALAVLLGFVVRPLLVALVLIPLRLPRNEQLFVLWSGLKGAVPILLGTFILTAHVTPSGTREPAAGATAVDVYHIVFVVVAFSVIVQGGLVPAIARRLRLAVRTVEPEPWALGMRFRDEPNGLRRFTVTRGSPADGTAIGDLPVGENVWVSFVSRRGQLVQVRGETVLRTGDEVLILCEPADATAVAQIFTAAEG